MDGYGVSLIDVGHEVELVKTIYAGDFSNDDFSLQPRTAVKIMTGAKIPKGVNSVIPAEELASPEFGKIQLPNSIQPFKHIRKQGEDIQIDEVLISKGEKLNPYNIGVLASQGISHIKVFKKPRVTIFATGKELKMHYENLEGSQIYNTNSPTLIAKCEMLGAENSLIPGGNLFPALPQFSSRTAAQANMVLNFCYGFLFLNDINFAHISPTSP